MNKFTVSAVSASPFNSIQFNSKPLFKDGDPVSLKLIFPGVIQTCKQIQQLFIYIYKTTQAHQTITGINTTYTFIQCIYNSWHTLSLMNKKEQYIVNNKYHRYCHHSSFSADAFLRYNS